MLVSIYRLQKEFFKCFSKSRVFWGLLNAIAVLIRHGFDFEMQGFLQPFASLLSFEAKAGRGEIYPPVFWRGTCQPQADLNAPEAQKPPWRVALSIPGGI